MSIELEKRNSSIDGLGVFTRDVIFRGSEFYQIPLDMVYSEPNFRCARIADGIYVSDEKVLNYVNHSCDPNSMLDIDRDDPVLIALRDIYLDEEITVNYNETEMQGSK